LHRVTVVEALEKLGADSSIKSRRGEAERFFQAKRSEF
jgi:hypothetical protein